MFCSERDADRIKTNLVFETPELGRNFSQKAEKFFEEQLKAAKQTTS